MPEPYWPKRRGSFTLAAAEKNARYAVIRCTYCKMERYFLLHELRIAFGNIECDDVVYQGRWRCTGCDGKGSLEMKVEDPPGDKLGNVIVRRLDRVEYVRRPVWRDKRGV